MLHRSVLDFATSDLSHRPSMHRAINVVLLECRWRAMTFVKYSRSEQTEHVRVAPDAPGGADSRGCHSKRSHWVCQ
jgi:hypothetical protein